MDEQDIVREICAAIPIRCLRCGQSYRLDRVNLIGKTRKGRLVYGLCGDCNRTSLFFLNDSFRGFKRACFAVLGERSIAEELKLRLRPIPTDYENQLPDVLGEIWLRGPKEDPNRPLEPA